MGLSMMEGHRLESAFDAIRHRHSSTVIILENDLYRCEEKELVDEFLQNSKQVILLDHLYHHTAGQAHAIIPAGTFAEADGPLLSCEGRAQRFFQVYEPEKHNKESWRWLQALGTHGRAACREGV